LNGCHAAQLKDEPALFYVSKIIFTNCKKNWILFLPLRIRRFDVSPFAKA
jgi:hypothetical protein